MIDKLAHSTNDYEPPQEATPPSNVPPKERGTGFALFIAFTALFFTAAGIAAGYKHWQRMNEKAKNNQAAILQLQQTLARKSDTTTMQSFEKHLEKTLSELKASVATKLQNMESLQNQTEQFANTVTAQVEQVTHLQALAQQAATPNTTQEWKLEEVAFLLKTASYQLHLANNPQAAIAALKSADERLGDIGSISFMPVRQQIGRDLSKLENIQQTDLLGISQIISKLALNLPALDFTGQVVQTSTKSSPSTESNSTPETSSTEDLESKELSIWQQYKQNASDFLGQTFLITELDEPITTTLTTTSRQSLYQLLQLRLENLRLLALQEKDQDYHQQVDLIRTTLQTYYPTSALRPLLAQLDQLDKINISPEQPDISGSLVQLEKARRIYDAEQEQQP